MKHIYLFCSMLACVSVTYAKDSMYSSINDFPNQIKEARAIGQALSVAPFKEKINGIVFAGMGGSGVAGQVVATTIAHDLSVPVEMVKGYTLPNWVNEQTLVILLSYSGNTEETLACYADAQKRKAHIAGIASGGFLAAELQKNNNTWIAIPGGLQPRAALALLSIPIYFYLIKVGLICNAVVQTIDSMEVAIRHARDLYHKAKDSNLAYKIAQKLQNKIPLLYGSNDATEVVATRWRAQFAENSKILSSTNVLPEMNHNELEAFSNKRYKQEIAVVWFFDDAMHERTKKRHKICSDLIAPYVAANITINLKGETFMERLFHALYLGDWVSYWLAELNHTDPLVIPMISALKETMKDNV